FLAALPSRTRIFMPCCSFSSASSAVKLRPDLSKTRTVLGFAYLTQIDTEAAKAAFAKAIEFDQADPMPRLGMGLAKIREGDLEAGRVELEIAASLDPANSLIRSYLGKAYFEEKRYGLAETQFALAKERDPNDPTPWLYDGIMKQTQNQPVEALRDIQKSIELNDNRAVYRSQFLLDQDQAARGSSLARIYDNLGFDRRAIMETAKSLTQDPSNHSAHRFLSDAYLNSPRHEIARVSELLQAQLLQPVNVNPVQPQLAVADLNIITGTGPTHTGFNEFAPLMERNKPQFVGSGIFGSNNTLGNEAVLSALYGRASVSVGQFYYHTDGFRPNNDQKHNIYNAFIQYAVTPKFNVQAEMRTRKTEHGDLLMDFDREPTQNRRLFDQDTARVGTKYTLSPHQDLIASAIYTNNKNRTQQSDGSIQSLDEDNPSAPTYTQNDQTREKTQGYQAETQYLLRANRFNITLGAGVYRFSVQNQTQTNTIFLPSSQSSPCDSDPDSCHVVNTPTHFTRDQNKGYIYTNTKFKENLNVTFGFVYDSYKEATFNFSKFNPKLGMQWEIAKGLRLRTAWFETVKSALIANQTIEPTQVAGFNQLFDDINGTWAQRMGVGVDTHLSKKVYSGIEASARDLKVPLFNKNDLDHIQEQHESLYRAYLYWLPTSQLAIRVEPQFERFARSKASAGDGPSVIDTFSAPITFSYFSPTGIFSRFSTTYIQQKLQRGTPNSNAENSNFWLLDASINYRLPKRRGIVSVEGRNLLDRDFSYRNQNFEISQQFYNQRFTPGRTFFVRLTINF
ncbi:MAG: TonB-dependent receptor, partial [Nitrosospira sp.]